MDWTSLIDGDDPRNRRVFADPVAARQRVLADLSVARTRLRTHGICDLEVDGPMRLPLWFAIGAHFSSTAGFAVSAQARDGLWSSTVSPSAQADLQMQVADCGNDDLRGRPWAVSVSFALDIAEDVEEYLAGACPEAYHLRARLPSPGRAALAGAPHARALIYQLRDDLRTLRRQLRPPELHLFLAMPAACALLLGNAWDRMPLTWTYWDLGQPGQYAPAMRVDN